MPQSSRSPTPRQSPGRWLLWLVLACAIASASLGGAQTPSARSVAEREFAQLRTASELALNQLDFAAAQALHRRMRELANAHDQPLWLARALHNEGIAARRLGLNEEALKSFDDALALRRRHADKAGEIESLNAYSTLQRRAGNLYQALDGHTRALELARELQMPAMIAESLSKIGRIYTELDDLEPATGFYEQAIAAADPAELGELADLRSDLAGIYARQGRMDEARAMTLQALELAERSGQAAVIAGVYSRQSRLLLQAGEPQQALQWIDRAIAVGAPVSGARSVLVRQSARLGVLVALQRWAEAGELIESLLAEARRTGDLLVERTLMEMHGDILMANGDAAAAYAAARQAHLIQESMATTMTSRRIADLEASMQRRAIEADMALLERQGQVQQLVVERQRLIGAVLAALLVCVLLAALALVLRFRAVRRLHRALVDTSAKLECAARTDPLTGLGNRQAIPDALEFDRIARERGEHCGVILIDLDHFKRVNDQHGHLAGDQVLQATASTLRITLPAQMQLVRWGGEEFLAFGTFANVDAAVAVAESLRRALRAHPAQRADAAPAIAVSISVGICVANAPISDWEALISSADTALYQAKDGGRNRVCVAA
jgi:diguanylate cyclase (GGDEF)-like protein